MLILYITYIDFGQNTSGSVVRPQKMYDAFLEEGHTVKLLCGAQGNIHSRGPRLQAVKEIELWLDSHRPDLCYVESPVYPILWGRDRRLIDRLHRMGIPVGYFYRDLYRKFPGLFPRRRDPAGAAKEAVLDQLQKATDRLLEKADIVYFPSEECFSFFDYRDMRTLPPGGEDHMEEAMPEFRHCIYVGGMRDQYDGECLLKAFSLLNRDGNRYPLTLVCRHNE
ncbi:MAG: glycosyl transferase family 1, partial [Lachnospiraceae bacterium]|nr:glycosyl transferase family 1 [Lachnospiraceae bacterium]